MGNVNNKIVVEISDEHAFELLMRIYNNHPPATCPFCRWELKPGRIHAGAGTPADAYRNSKRCPIHQRQHLLTVVSETAHGLVVAIEQGIPDADHVRNVQEALLAYKNEYSATGKGDTTNEK